MYQNEVQKGTVKKIERVDIGNLNQGLICVHQNVSLLI